MNLRKYEQNPRKLRISCTFFGVKKLLMAFNLWGTGRTPSLDTNEQCFPIFCSKKTYLWIEYKASLLNSFQNWLFCHFFLSAIWNVKSKLELYSSQTVVFAKMVGILHTGSSIKLVTFTGYQQSYFEVTENLINAKAIRHSTKQRTCPWLVGHSFYALTEF